MWNLAKKIIKLSWFTDNKLNNFASFVVFFLERMPPVVTKMESVSAYVDRVILQGLVVCNNIQIMFNVR